jgi:excisionase family DNA binding protein
MSTDILGAGVLTVEEAGRALRISRGTAYALARRGVLPSVRVGRSLRVPRAGLARLLESAGRPAPCPRFSGGEEEAER